MTEVTKIVRDEDCGCSCGESLTVMKISTHNPDKWELHDKETGEVWVIHNGYWKIKPGTIQGRSIKR